MNHLVKKEILGVQISDITKEHALEYVVHRVSSKGGSVFGGKNGEEKTMIFTPNPEIVVHAQRHPRFKALINEADLALCDGVGLLVAGDLLGQHFKQRIPGVDFMEELCSFASKNRLSIGLLGGRRGVADRTAQCLREKYQNLKIVFTAEQWTPHIVPREGIDILFVAFGFPKQEEWIAEHLPHIPVRAAMGVGGSFDYLSGNVHRAPFFIRAIGLEWLYRLIRQPWRAKRQLALLTFIRLVLKERFARKR